MNRVLVFGSLLLGAGLLASCQSLSKDECVAADWRVIGEQDGAEGRDPEARFKSHVRACERAGVVPDQTAWYAGFQQGLVRFCTPLSGLSAGQAGKTYHNICPPQSEPDFLRGYRLGLAAHNKQGDIRQGENNISRAESEITRLEKLVDEGKIDEGEARRLIRQENRNIRDSERDIDRHRLDLARIERDIDWFQRNPDADLPFSY